MTFPRIAKLKSHADFCQRLNELQLEIPCDEVLQNGPESPLGKSLDGNDFSVGNRFSILPMEGWDGTKDGKPSDLTRRRWGNFGRSGAKLIWGGEAIAVRHDGRANPNQLLINDANLSEIESLRTDLVETHQNEFGKTNDLLVGLQLTHSGRYARPNVKEKIEPMAAQRNWVLDQRIGIKDDSSLISDDELKQLIDDFAAAAVLAEKAGFQFVDVKHCHGYLGHELLSAIDRPGIFGGSFENRTRFLRDIVAAIESRCQGMKIGVRVSIFDFVPFTAGADAIGNPDGEADPRLFFGSSQNGYDYDLDEPAKFLQLIRELGIRLVCTTAGSPYYNPHIQRPAIFPPSDGYQPPEDPLVGVARQLRVTAELKKQFPDLIFVGSGYSYLQEWLPNVGQAVVTKGWADSIGLGRMVLSYPELPADVLAGSGMKRKKICRTFSDCTTAARKGKVSGCYPLDPLYKEMAKAEMNDA